jgi:hypothetical protein
LEAVNEVQVKIVQKAIMAGRIAGELKNQTDARSIALYIVGQLMGCYTISKVRASKETFVSMVGTMQKQLKDVLVVDAEPRKMVDSAMTSAPSSSVDRVAVVNPFANNDDKSEEKSSRGGWFSRNR